MKREFVIKMLKAKKMEYEALKEIMPDKLLNKITELENELIDMAKEYMMSEFTEFKGQNKTSEGNKSKKVQKVTIES